MAERKRQSTKKSNSPSDCLSTNPMTGAQDIICPNGKIWELRLHNLEMDVADLKESDHNRDLEFKDFMHNMTNMMNRMDDIIKSTEKNNETVNKTISEVHAETKENADKIAVLEAANDKKLADGSRKVLSYLGMALLGILFTLLVNALFPGLKQ